MSGFGLMIGKGSVDRQHAGYDRYHGNVGCSFRFTTDEKIDYLNQRPQRRK